MPKLKTNKAARKRFKITKGGKVLRRHASGSHLLSSKNSKRKRRLKRVDLVKSTHARHVRDLLPNG